MLRLERYFSEKSHVIWDWNGTLLNDGHLCHEIMCEMLQESGRPPLTQEEHRKLFRMPVQNFYLELGFDFSTSSFPDLAREFFARYAARVSTKCELFQGCTDLLESLQRTGKSLAVLSAAKESDLLGLLAHYKIDGYFDHICGLKDHAADSKVARGRELLEIWKVDPGKTILVGDMDHDLEVAMDLGIDVLLLGDGHQHYDRFASHPLSLPTRYFEDK